MNLFRNLLITILLLFNDAFSFSQEWKNLNEYKKRTGQILLPPGNWCKKDRKRTTEVWNLANNYNLSVDTAYLKYKTIREKRDFYRWFDEERKKRGHEITIIGIAADVAGQLSRFDNFFVKTLLIRDKEIIWFTQEGSERVFQYAFPLLKDLYFSPNKLKQEEASVWDFNYVQKEQCEIVELVYAQVPVKSIEKLEYIAKGKGIYKLAVKKRLRFQGQITDCKARYDHALFKLLPYYLENNKL